ncbi:MAG: STAS domain-containing protein [Lachnospiraceae bacterium]|nr:STAS domain-containing protein [Lachnospiraceae bacterium]
MLNIKKEGTAEDLTVVLEGRLDTTTAPQLDEELKASLEKAKNLVFDLKALEYVSSAGLRVFLSAQKVMNRQGSMTIKNANEEIKEIFDVTGFVDILNIE